MAASAEFFTLVVSSVSAAEVSCRLLAEVSVRSDRSRLPISISPVADFMFSTLARTSSSTSPILSMKVLNDAEICATSSLPTTGRRCVRSPPPEPMVSIASRTCDSRRNDCAVKNAAMPTAASVSSTIATPSARTTLRRPAVASALSSAITRYQSVPCTACALSSLAAPASSTSSGAVALASDDSASGVSATATSVTGLSISLASGCAITWPSRATTKARLDGVGCTAATTSRTPSSGTAPLSAPVASPLRISGAANDTYGTPVDASP